MQHSQNVQIYTVLHLWLILLWLEGRDCRTKLPGATEKLEHAGFDEHRQDSTNKFAQKVSKCNNHY